MQSLAGLLAWVWLAQPPLVVEIRVEGSRVVPEETILLHLRHLQGQPLEEARLAGALRRLWETGLFEDIVFRREEAGPGQVRLTVEVREKPLLREIRFSEGDLPLSREELLRRLEESGFGIRPLRPLGQNEASRAARVLENVLGRDRFRVTARLESNRDGSIDLLFLIEARHPPLIEQIDFEGNQALSEKELRRAMELQASGLASFFTRRNRFSPEELDRDLERIRSLYLSRGFFTVEVGPARVEVSKSDRVRLTIPIREGQPYRLGGIDIEPGSILTAAEVLSAIPLAPGESYNAVAVRQAVESVKRQHQNRGYPGAQVRLEERPDPALREIHLKVIVEAGTPYLVGRIEFQGNRWSPDRGLRSFVSLRERDRFSLRAIEESGSHLMALGYFRTVRPEVTLRPERGEADVTFHVEESLRFDYLLGGGVSGDEGTSANGLFRAASLLGRGEILSVSGDLGNRFQNGSLEYFDPFLLGRRLAWSAGWNRRVLEHPDDTSDDLTALSFRVAGPLGQRWQIQLRFTYSLFELGSDLEEPVPFLTPFLGRRFDKRELSAAWAFDSRDDPFLPSRGLHTLAGGVLAGGALGGDVSLARLLLQTSQIFSLGGGSRHFLLLRGRAERVFPFSDTRQEGLPRFERLFLGGEEDLRGFSVRGVGPLTSELLVVGGDQVVFGSVEYQYALAKVLRLAGFFDVGNVCADDFSGPELPLLRYDAGAELRLRAPVFKVPLRLGYGVNLDRLPHEPRGRFYLALAAQF